MSDPKQFLARWSRRKTEARVGNAHPSVPATEMPAHDAGQPNDPQKDMVETFVDLASLPSVEDITAETNLSAFLAPGLPLDVTRAALRRAWSVDANIRDFIGPADYAWDFNAPGSMAGFGPLAMNEAFRDALVQRLFQTPKSIEDGAGGTAKADSSQALSVESPETGAVGHLPVIETNEPEPILAENQGPETSITTETAPRRKHGGALPI